MVPHTSGTHKHTLMQIENSLSFGMGFKFTSFSRTLCVYVCLVDIFITSPALTNKPKQSKRNSFSKTASERMRERKGNKADQMSNPAPHRPKNTITFNQQSYFLLTVAFA